MKDWHWLALGLVGGFLLTRAGGRLGGGLSVSAGFGAGMRRPPGSGAVPLDQPNGSEPYQTVGAYNPYYSAGFPDLIDPRAQGRIIETDSPGTGYIQ